MARTVRKLTAQDAKYVEEQDLFEVKENDFLLGTFSIQQTIMLIDAGMEAKVREMGRYDTEIAKLQQQKTDMEALIA